MAEKEDTDRIIDTVTDQEQEHAQTALIEFKKCNYIGALQSINKLENRGYDFKVVHNKALVEYCKSDFKKNETFQKNLTSIGNQFRIKVEKLDDVDQCIIHFNQAILLYHQRQYTQAIAIMDRVYKFIEPMDDALAKQVSLFAVELQLCVRQSEKALSLISYLENQLLNGTPNIKILDKSIKEKDVKVLPPLDPATEEFKKKLLKYKIRCYLMNHNLETVAKEISLMLKDKQNIEGMFFGANLEYLKGNFVESQKLLATVPNDALLPNDCGESSTVIFYNNMGVIHHAMGKPNLACHYFQLALKEDMALTKTGKKDIKSLDEKPLHTLGGSKYHELMYNLGIALLYTKRSTQAFDCLIIAVRRYHRNSRLWMRLAECCIMAAKESNEVDFDIRKKQEEIVMDVVGSREKQKVILTTNLSKDKKYNSESQSYAVPVPSLEFASLCLRNAYTLLPSDIASSPVPLFLIPGVTPPVPSSTPGPAPSSPLSPESVICLRNGILAASAYVALCLGDYILALEHAEELLKQPKLSGAHKLLGHLYCAESLVLLDKITEALDHLNPENVQDVNLELPMTESEMKKTKTAPASKWFPNNLTTAQATMQYNIAVCKTIRGQLDEAKDLLKQVWQMSNKCKVPGHIIMLVLYIELKLGHPEPARNLIKQYLFQNRL